jgi:hypothetical protein
MLKVAFAIKVSQPNYIPAHAVIRAKISDYLYTIEIPEEYISIMCADPMIIQISQPKKETQKRTKKETAFFLAKKMNCKLINLNKHSGFEHLRSTTIGIQEKTTEKILAKYSTWEAVIYYLKNMGNPKRIYRKITPFTSLIARWNAELHPPYIQIVGERTRAYYFVYDMEGKEIAKARNIGDVNFYLNQFFSIN